MTEQKVRLEESQINAPKSFIAETFINGCDLELDIPVFLKFLLTQFHLLHNKFDPSLYILHVGTNDIFAGRQTGSNT